MNRKKLAGWQFATSSQRWRRRARILVAEDNTVNQEVAIGILNKLRIRADAMADGTEAVEALKTLPCELVLMDMPMPEMDGLEAKRIIRDPLSPVTNHQIPVIAMTANAYESPMNPGRRSLHLKATYGSPCVRYLRTRLTASKHHPPCSPPA